VVVTVSSAACPATSGHRKITVASTMTSSAQPIAPAEEASEALRARQISSSPTAETVTRNHWSNTVRRRLSTTLETRGSKTPRKSGWNAALSTAPVAATAALGSVNT
jgi:hypothetical protein